MKIAILTTSFIIVLLVHVNGQVKMIDSVKLNYKKIYSWCLDADVSSALKEINVDRNRISSVDKKFITTFENRFAEKIDNSSFLKEHSSKIDKLLSVFHSYWRMALLDTSKKYDSLFVRNINVFFSKAVFSKDFPQIKEDSLDYYFNQYIKANNLYSTNGVGKTGKIYDLLVWKTQKDTTYSFNLYKEKITANVMLMSDFITLGWEEYATLGKYYPGGWATDKTLYCVASAYDLNSEDFLISYLAHEGRHFKDYKLFPKLKNSADLEYRAKLTELSLAKNILYELIEFFVSNANLESSNGHQIANYRAIKDISKELFKTDFEKDIKKWKLIKPEKINKAAYKVLDKNTKELHKLYANLK